jgi:hypothetical protein
MPLGEAVKNEFEEGADYSVSSSGSLIYLPDNPQRLENRLVWVNRNGGIEQLPAPPRPYSNPQISPLLRSSLVTSFGSPPEAEILQRPETLFGAK